MFPSDLQGVQTVARGAHEPTGPRVSSFVACQCLQQALSNRLTDPSGAAEHWRATLFDSRFLSFHRAALSTRFKTPQTATLMVEKSPLASSKGLEKNSSASLAGL